MGKSNSTISNGRIIEVIMWMASMGASPPTGKIYMDLFLERGPTVRSVVNEVKDDGTLGKEISREGRSGLIRDIEAGLIFDLPVAEKLR